jgi:hypothetical protein
VSPRLIVAFLAAMVVIAGGAVPAFSRAVEPDTDRSVVPQTISYRGEPGYKIVPASEFHPTPTGSSSWQTVFRGGRHSAPNLSTGTTPAPPRSMLAPSSPRIAVYGTLNKPGLTAGSATPPDSTGAIGPSNYVEMTNSRVAVYDRSLNLVSSTTLAAFMGLDPAVYFMCDPQIQWVPSANRWLYLFLDCNAPINQQAFEFGWSKTSDPTTLSSAGWCQFTYVTGANLFDYPKLGHNKNYLIVGGNFYNNPTTANPALVGASILWAPLPANGVTTCTLPAFTGTSGALKNGDGVSNAFTPVPVNTHTSATDGYIVSAYDPFSPGPTSSPKAKVSVWHLNSAGALLQDNDVAVNTFDVPTSAPQLNGIYPIDTLDARLTQAVGDPAAGFYTQHTVAGASGRSEVQWYQFVVSGSTVVLAQQGRISSATDWVFDAAISPRSDGLGAAIAYNRSSSSIYPLIAARVRFQATPPGTWSAGELVLATSATFDNDRSCSSPPPPTSCRWGDYAAATPDPVLTNLVWGTGEFNTASTSAPAWSDQNFALWVAVSPMDVAAVADDASATVSWSPPPSEFGPVTNYLIKAYAGAAVVATMTTTSPVTLAQFKGLTNGTTYTFTVTANGPGGPPSSESMPSNAVTPTRAPSQTSSAPVPPRDPVNPSGGAPTPTGR